MNGSPAITLHPPSSAQKRHHGRDADPPTPAARQRGHSDDHHQLPGPTGAGAGVLRERFPGAAAKGPLRLLHPRDRGPPLPDPPARRTGVRSLVGYVPFLLVTYS